MSCSFITYTVCWILFCFTYFFYAAHNMCLVIYEKLFLVFIVLEIVKNLQTFVSLKNAQPQNEKELMEINQATKNYKSKFNFIFIRHFSWFFFLKLNL